MEVDVDVARLNVDSPGAFDHAQVIGACRSCRILAGTVDSGIYKQRQTSLVRAYMQVRVHLCPSVLTFSPSSSRFWQSEAEHVSF